MQEGDVRIVRDSKKIAKVLRILQAGAGQGRSIRPHLARGRFRIFRVWSTRAKRARRH